MYCRQVLLKRGGGGKKKLLKSLNLETRLQKLMDHLKLIPCNSSTVGLLPTLSHSPLLVSNRGLPTFIRVTYVLRFLEKLILKARGGGGWRACRSFSKNQTWFLEIRFKQLLQSDLPLQCTPAGKCRTCPNVPSLFLQNSREDTAEIVSTTCSWNIHNAPGFPEGWCHPSPAHNTPRCPWNPGKRS